MTNNSSNPVCVPSIKQPHGSKIEDYNSKIMTSAQFRRKIDVDKIVHAPKLTLEVNSLFN